MHQKRRSATRSTRYVSRSRGRSKATGIDWHAIAAAGGIPKNSAPKTIDRRKQARNVAREKAYDRPWVRGCCQACGRSLVLKPSEARHELDIANAHEITFRSKGGDPTDTRNLLIVCGRCNVDGFHRRGPRSAWLSVIVKNPDLIADDPYGVEIVPWNGKAVTYG